MNADPITIRPVNTAPITVRPTAGLPVTVRPLDTEPMTITGLANQPGPRGAQGLKGETGAGIDTFDTNILAAFENAL